MMHRSIAIIMLIMVSLYAKAQNFQTITRVVFEQGKISGYNSLNKLAVQVHCGDMVWQVLPDNSIKIWDDIHSFTVFSTTLTVPAFAALGDSLRAWQVSCGQSSTPFPTNLDTTHIDTSLIVPTLIENFSIRNNDTLSAILAAIAAHKDTSNYYILDSINYRLSLLDKSDIDTSLVLPDILAKFATKNNDTLSAILLALNNLTPNDTSNFWIFDSIYQELKAVDTLCFTGEIAVKDSLLRTTVVDCNGTNAINVKICDSGDTTYIEEFTICSGVGYAAGTTSYNDAKDPGADITTFQFEVYFEYNAVPYIGNGLGSNGWHLMNIGDGTQDIEDWINSLGLADVFYVTQNTSGNFDMQIATLTANGFTVGGGNVFQITQQGGGFGMGFNWDNLQPSSYGFGGGVTTIIDTFSKKVKVVNPIAISSVCGVVDVNITSGLVPTNTILENIRDNQRDGTQLSKIYDSNTGAVATVVQGDTNSTNSNTAIVVSERPKAAQFGAVADLVTSHTTSSVIPTASTLEVIVENIGTASTTITYQGVNMPLDVKQQRVFHAIWDEARRIYSPIGTLVVNGTASATIVVIIKNPQ